MARKLGVVVSLAVFSSVNDNAQAVGALVVLTVALMHLISRRAYRSTFHNLVARVILASVLAVLAGTCACP